MTALRPSEIEGFLRKPPDRVSLVLVYGQDDGLVAERAGAIVRAASGKADDPFSLVRLDGSDLASDPARLADEAGTVSLFGTRRVVWVRDCGARNILPAVQPLLDDPIGGSLVVLEAGDLKKGTGLRKKVEDHPSAIAIACWADSAEDISRLVERELKDAGLSIDRDARELLESHLGGDRMATRGELRKLCLYALGKTTVTLDDVVAIVGDASAFALDELHDATAGGDAAAADRVLGRLVASGTPASVAGTMLVRHFQLLERLRAEVTAGKSAADAVAGVQPPIFARRRPAVLRQVTLWTPQRLARALALLDEAMWRSRQMPHLATAVMAETILTLARVAAAAVRR